MKMLQSVAPDSNHSNLLSLEPELYILLQREKKMTKIISLENTKQTFIDNPDVSLLSPHTGALRSLIETHI